MHRNTRLRHKSLGFFFSRLLILGTTGWQGYVQDVALLPKLGGWVEIQDYNFGWYIHGLPCSDKWDWAKAIFKAAKQKGLDLNRWSKIKGYMARAGPVDVQRREFRVPAGTWPAEARPETRQIGEHSAREYPTMCYDAIPRMLGGLGHSAEEIEDLRQEGEKVPRDRGRKRDTILCHCYQEP